MQRITLDSKTISSVAYDEEASVLHVWLRNRRHIVHQNVSEGVFQNLVTAEPPDFYYNFYINDQPRQRGSSLMAAAKIVSVCALGLLFLGVTASPVKNPAFLEITGAIK